MAGETPGIQIRVHGVFVRHGDVTLGTTLSLRNARIMRDLYTIASGSRRVPLCQHPDNYVHQFAAVENMDLDQRRALCAELIEAFRLFNGTTLRPLIDGRQMTFPDRPAAVVAIYRSRGEFTHACRVLLSALVARDE
jgi:hypothetical protein